MAEPKVETDTIQSSSLRETLKFWLFQEKPLAPSSDGKHASTEYSEQEGSPDQHTQPKDPIERQHTDDHGLSAFSWPNPQWLLNRRKNETTSKFYGFSSELLLLIFGKADFLTQQMLRSTCSRFAELIVCLDVNRAEAPFAPRFNHLEIWPRHGTEAQRLAVRQQWSTLVRRDRSDLCKECEAFEQSGKLEKAMKKLRKTLWCASCQRHHVRGMFSSAQRKQWWFHRMCIGWEGRLRLCPHVSCSWGQAEVQKRRSKMHSQPGKQVMSLVHCPKNCHWPDSYNSFWSNEPTPCKLNDRHYSWRIDHDTRTVPELAATWANHAFDIDPDRPLTRHTFRKVLEKLNTGNNGPYLCPHVRIDDGQLLLPFQPGFCCCFSDTVEPGYKTYQHRHINCPVDVCRCRTESSPDPATKIITLESYKGGFSHVYTCYECKAHYFWRRRQDTFHLEYFTDMFARSPTSGDWIRKLDPHSWNITDDVESRHVYWCPNTSCRTNCRWKAFYRRLWK